MRVFQATINDWMDYPALQEQLTSHHTNTPVLKIAKAHHHAILSAQGPGGFDDAHLLGHEG
jgi:hypothetical protein